MMVFSVFLAIFGIFRHFRANFRVFGPFLGHFRPPQGPDSAQNSPHTNSCSATPVRRYYSETKLEPIDRNTSIRNNNNSLLHIVYIYKRSSYQLYRPTGLLVFYRQLCRRLLTTNPTGGGGTSQKGSPPTPPGGGGGGGGALLIKDYLSLQGHFPPLS